MTVSRYPSPDTLVAYIPSPGDFMTAREQRWYRIPCRSAPVVLPKARWLAFYHPAAFGTLKWAVHFFAPIERIERVDLYHESPLEDGLWDVLRSANIPAERQYDVKKGKTRYCLDFAVLCARSDLDVECDGDSWHLRPNAVAEDNARNNFLASLGWSVLRFSSRELSPSNIAGAVDLVRATSERLGGIELPNQANRRFDRAGNVVEQYRLW